MEMELVGHQSSVITLGPSYFASTFNHSNVYNIHSLTFVNMYTFLLLTFLSQLIHNLIDSIQTWLLSHGMLIWVSRFPGGYIENENDYHDSRSRWRRHSNANISNKFNKIKSYENDIEYLYWVHLSKSSYIFWDKVCDLYDDEDIHLTQARTYRQIEEPIVSDP